MAHGLSLSSTGEPFQNSQFCLNTRVGHISQSNDLWLSLSQQAVDVRQGESLLPPVQPLWLDHTQTLRSYMENHIVAEPGEFITMSATFWVDLHMADLREMPL